MQNHSGTDRRCRAEPTCREDVKVVGDAQSGEHEELSAAGVKAVTKSASPGNMPRRTSRWIPLPALATNTRELLGSAAAWVGLMPMFAWPMLVSPETSICSALPGLDATLVLMPKTAWKFAGFGGVVLIGITTGR